VVIRETVIAFFLSHLGYVAQKKGNWAKGWETVFGCK